MTSAFGYFRGLWNHKSQSNEVPKLKELAPFGRTHGSQALVIWVLCENLGAKKKSLFVEKGLRIRA
jgi:hypothetical protein